MQDTVDAPRPPGLWTLAFCVFAAATLVVALRSSLGQAARLYDATLPAFPWFVPENAVLLYGMAPLAVLAAIALVLAPGLILMVRRGQAGSLEEILLKGFLISGSLHMTVTSVWKLLAGGLPLSGLFAWLIGAPLLCLLWPQRQVSVQPNPAQTGQNAVRIGVHVAIVTVLLWVLAPLIYWQDLTGDGAELLYLAQSLDSNVVPRFTDPTPMATLGVGMIFQPIVASWFLAIFDGAAVAVRLLAVVFAPLLFAAVVLVVERGSRRTLRTSEVVAIAVALLVFVVSMALNATYNPYATDIGSPAGVEIGTVALALATVYLFQTREWAWFFVAVTLGLLCRPIELVVLAGLGLATVTYGSARRSDLVPLLLTLPLAVAIGSLLQLSHVGGEPFSSPPLTRFEYIRLLDVRQLLITVVGAGIVPVLAVIRFRSWDATGRALAVVLGLTFLVVYLPAFYALHHMALVMVLGIALFWRSVMNGLGGNWVPASVAGSALALLLAIPQGPVLSRVHREMAQSIHITVGSIEGTFEERRRAVQAAHALEGVFPGVDGADERVYRGNWLSLAYYATPHPTEHTRFELRAADATGTGEQIAATTHGSVWARSRGEWESGHAGDYPTAFRSRLYAIPRSRLLRHVGVWVGDEGYHLGSVPVVWRFVSPPPARDARSEDE